MSEPTLDDVFLRQTGRSLRDAGEGGDTAGGAAPAEARRWPREDGQGHWLAVPAYLTQLLRNPVWVVVGFSTPILYLALFTPLLKHLVGSGGLPTGNVLDLFLPGILSLLAFASGIGPGFSTIFELKAGVIERFRVTPASRFAILIGPILASMVMMLVFDAVVVAVGFGFGFSVHWAGLAVLAVLLGLLMVDHGRVLDRHRAGHQGDQRLRRDHQRHQPADPAAGRGAAADLPRPGLDARAGALQPAVLPGPGVPGAGRAARCPAPRSGRRSPCSCRCALLVLAWATRVFRTAVA